MKIHPCDLPQTFFIVRGCWINMKINKKNALPARILAGPSKRDAGGFIRQSARAALPLLIVMFFKPFFSNSFMYLASISE